MLRNMQQHKSIGSKFSQFTNIYFIRKSSAILTDSAGPNTRLSLQLQFVAERNWGVCNTNPITPNTFLFQYACEVVTKESLYDDCNDVLDGKNDDCVFDGDDDNDFAINTEKSGNIDR